MRSGRLSSRRGLWGACAGVFACVLSYWSAVARLREAWGVETFPPGSAAYWWCWALPLVVLAAVGGGGVRVVETCEGCCCGICGGVRADGGDRDVWFRVFGRLYAVLHVTPGELRSASRMRCRAQVTSRADRDG